MLNFEHDQQHHDMEESNDATKTFWHKYIFEWSAT